MSHWLRENEELLHGLDSAEKNDLSAYEGNAQGFRVLTQLENHLFEGGLRLTYATLGAFLKYPHTKQECDNKFSVYKSEAHILTKVAKALGMVGTNNIYARHPLAYLVEAADDICYSVLDLEDAVELKLLSFEDVQDVLLSQFTNRETDCITDSFEHPEMFRVNLARMRGPVFDNLVEAALEGFMAAYDAIMEGTYDRPDVFEALPYDDPRTAVIRKAKKLARNEVYTDTKKVEIELGAYSTLSKLLEPLMEGSLECAVAIREGRIAELGWKSRLVKQLLGDHAPSKDNSPSQCGWTNYQCYRRAIDFVGGMTDNYATYIAKQISGMAYAGAQRP